MAVSSRLTRADFSKLANEKGTRAHGAFFSVSATPLPKGKASKWACIVSKSVAAKSHDRNRIKRLCREAARMQIKKTNPAFTLIFRAKRESKGAPSKDINADIQFLIEKFLTRPRNISQ